MLSAIEALAQNRDKEVDFGPLLEAIQGIKIPDPIAEDGRAAEDLAEIKAKGNEMLVVLKAWQKASQEASVEGESGSGVAQALETLTAKIEALSAAQQGEAEESGSTQGQLDKVLQGIADIKAAGARLKEVPQNVLAAYGQAQEAAQQAVLAAAGHTSVGETLKEVKGTLREIEKALAELKGSAQANAQAVHSALQRPQSVPAGPPSMYGGGPSVARNTKFCK